MIKIRANDLRTERTDESFSDALIEIYIEKREKEGLTSDFQKFEKALRSAQVSTEVTPGLYWKTISGNLLGVLLAYSKIPAADVFKRLGVEIPYIDKAFPELVKLLEQIPERKRETLLEIANSISPSWWKEDKYTEFSTTGRTREMIRRRVAPADRKTIPVEPLRVSWKTMGGCAKINTLDTPASAAFLGVSLHWLLKLPDDAPCFSAEPYVDAIMDAYGMMPDPERKIFAAVVERSANGGAYYDF